MGRFSTYVGPAPSSKLVTAGDVIAGELTLPLPWICAPAASFDGRTSAHLLALMVSYALRYPPLCLSFS